MQILYLGTMIPDRESNHTSKEFYLSAKPKHMPDWTEKSYERHVHMASLNYDMNIRNCRNGKKSYRKKLSFVCHGNRGVCV